jgi:twitching motility protein PilT
MNDRNVEQPIVSEDFRGWLATAVVRGASDLHLIAGYPPVLRLHGDLTELPAPPLNGADTRALLQPLLSAEAQARLEIQKNLDFSLEVVLNGQLSRFRANVFLAEGHLGACLRVVPSVIPDFAWAEFPLPLAERLAPGHRDRRHRDGQDNDPGHAC